MSVYVSDSKLFATRATRATTYGQSTVNPGIYVLVTPFHTKCVVIIRVIAAGHVLDASGSVERIQDGIRCPVKSTSDEVASAIISIMKAKVSCCCSGYLFRSTVVRLRSAVVAL